MKIDITQKISNIYPQIEQQIKSRATRASNELRNATIEIMRGSRGGRVYKKQGTYGKTQSKATKALLGDYGKKLRGGQLYRSSAPGEPPAVRSGALRRSFAPTPRTEGGNIAAAIESPLKYAAYLQDGTQSKSGGVKMAPRPYRDEAIEKAMPKITEIYSAPYNIKL